MMKLKFIDIKFITLKIYLTNSQQTNRSNNSLYVRMKCNKIHLSKSKMNKKVTKSKKKGTNTKKKGTKSITNIVNSLICNPLKTLIIYVH